MAAYNVSDLTRKLKNNEELSDKEYNALIKFHRFNLLEELDVINNTDFKKTFGYLAGYMAIGKRIEFEAEYLLSSILYLCSTYNQTKINHIIALNGSNTASANLNRYNVLNFVRQREEADNYGYLLDNFGNKLINDLQNHDLFKYSENILEDDIEKLENSKEKIKIYSKNYFN